MTHIQIYDTTLRDGTQMEGISLSCDDKLRIAQRLDELGVAYIEGGWPGSNPKDAEFFERAQHLTWKHAKIAAFGSTRRKGITPAEDANIQALLAANTPVCTVVGKTWTLHVTDVIQTTLEENLRLIEDSLAYLKTHGKEVIYDAEHFFDGYKADPEYALDTLSAAMKGGAEMLVLCDTNGGSMPWEIARMVHEVQQALPSAKLGIHTHNDGECAVANSLAAIREGAIHVQGCINGYGERTGNANLCSIIPDLELKLGLSCLPNGHLQHLSEVANYVAEVANLSPNEHQPYVGRSAFAHKGGIHVAAMRRNPLSYQHIEPERVGNESRTVVSELSGRGNLLSKAEEFGLKVDNPRLVEPVLEEIKVLEARGFTFEAAEASVMLMIKRRQAGYVVPFTMLDFFALVEQRRDGSLSRGVVKVSIAGEEYLTVGEGYSGPVNALDKALRKALLPIYPKLESVALTDFKVRILDGAKGTAAITRVLIDSSNGQERWTTVGAGANIIEASLRALTDSYEYALELAQSTSDGTE
jgi:2-isopropylmalate synthase